MDDLDALLTPTVWEPRRCHVATVLGLLDPKDAAKLTAAVDDEHVPLANIAQWAAAKLPDAKLTNASLTRHRRRNTAGGCACP